MVYKLVAEKMNTTEKLHNRIDFQNLIYHYKDPTANLNFNDFSDAATLFDEIKSCRIKVANTEKNRWRLN